MSALPDSVALVLPPQWAEVPLDPEMYRRFVAEQVEEASRTTGGRRSRLRQVEVLAAALHRFMRQQRVVIAANYLAIETSGEDPAPESVEDDAQEVDAEIVSAGLVVSTVRRAELPAAVPLTAEVLVEAFSNGLPTDDAGVRFVNIEPPEVCDLGGMQAVRLLRLMKMRPRPGEEVNAFAQSYFVPVADGDAAVVQQFVTTNTDYARQFSELFGKIANTLRVLYPDDPTFPAAPAVGDDVAG